MLPAAEDTGVESVLNRLDETMSMLASLHGQNSRGRRGKIDIAALIWEIAPEARVQIEMGKGLVVFGEESELKRMLHVLMAQAGDPIVARSVEVGVKREGEEIKIAVQLSPDKSQGSHEETQWLSRMAIRYGGRLALEGDKQTLVLPANDEQREVEVLRRELAAAQAQGEAYQRELAAVMGKSDAPPSMRSGSSQLSPSAETLGVLVASSRAILTDIRGILAAIGRDVTPLRDRARWGDRGEDVGEIGASVSRHVMAANEVVTDLSKLASCSLFDLPSSVHIGEVVRDVVAAESARAARHDVKLELDVQASSDDLLNSSALAVLFHAMINNAIASSGGGATVRIGVSETSSSDEKGVRSSAVVVTVDDSGTPLSQKAKASVPNRDFEALAHERMTTLPLIVVASIASFLRAPLSIEDAPSGGTRVRVTFARPQ